jgi:hypothetical protein
MRERSKIESDLRTLKRLETKEDISKKGIFLLLDLMDNQQLMIEVMLDIRELLKKSSSKRKKD